ncbi:MAG TPA: M20/M25/M40 family metallo-hydrolase [Acidimicrobiia bacterium]|nr:M20/M25/M40 family metallo-hydrolase [Acidimicrobiia bacterium]
MPAPPEVWATTESIETASSILSDLVNIASVNPSYPGGVGEGAVAEWLKERCRGIGLSVETQEVFPGRPNVLARLPADAGRGVLLFEAHLDTVSFGTPRMEAAQIAGNLLYGRGACDTKGSLTAMLIALERLTKRTAELPVDILLLGAVDEERSGGGARHFLISGGKADGAVVGEPTGLEIVVAHKGCIRFRIATRGRAAHSSKPEEGLNAIYAMNDVLSHLRSRLFPLANKRRHERVGSPTWSVGVITGGASVNIVPEQCSIELDYRSVPGEAVETVLAEVDTVLDQARGAHPGIAIEREDPFLVSWPLDTPISNRLVAAALKAKRLNQESLMGVPYGSDASLLATFGEIPSIVLGPGDINVAHGPEEHVDLREVALAADLYENIAIEFDPSADR